MSQSGSDADHQPNFPANAIDRWIGSRITLLRSRAGLSRRDFADMAGISEDLLEDYENGERRDGGDNLINICNLLEVSLPEFFEQLPLGEPTNEEIHCNYDSLYQAVTSLLSCIEQVRDTQLKARMIDMAQTLLSHFPSGN
jgi:transcriptional regulator with XRE-family HTH domain